MDLLTCFHTTADLEVLSEQDWRSGSASGQIDTSWIRKTFNSYDESALELACRFADACGPKALSCTRTCVTVGGEEADKHLATLAAVGYDHMIRITPEKQDSQRQETGCPVSKRREPGDRLSGVQETVTEQAAGHQIMSPLTPERVANLLTNLIRQKGSYDLILTGWQSGDGNQGKVPLLLAEQLRMRCVTQVTDVQPVDEERVRVTWQSDAGICTGNIRLPAVLVVGTVAGAFLRVPTLKQRMAAKQKQVEVFLEQKLTDSPDDSEHQAARLLGMEPVIERRNAVTVDGSDPAAAAEEILKILRKR